MKIFLSIILSLIFCSPVFAAVAFNNTNTMINTTGSSASSSMSVTAGGSNIAAFLCVGYDKVGGLSISNVTYGGQAMTSAGAASTNTTGHPYAEIYYLVNPPTGSNTVSITMSGSADDIYYDLTSFTGVNQTTPVRGSTYQNSVNSNNWQLVISSNANDLTMTCTNSSTFGISSTNQTMDDFNNNGNYANGTDHATTAASSVTHTWSPNSGGNIAIVGLSVDGDAPAPPPVISTTTIIGGAKIGSAKIGS